MGYIPDLRDFRPIRTDAEQEDFYEILQRNTVNPSTGKAGKDTATERTPVDDGLEQQPNHHRSLENNCLLFGNTK